MKNRIYLTKFHPGYQPKDLRLEEVTPQKGGTGEIGFSNVLQDRLVKILMNKLKYGTNNLL